MTVTKEVRGDARVSFLNIDANKEEIRYHRKPRKMHTIKSFTALVPTMKLSKIAKRRHQIPEMDTLQWQMRDTYNLPTLAV